MSASNATGRRSQIELQVALPEQLALFCELERDPDTAPYVLPTTLEQHRRAFAREEIIYLSIYDRGELGGFFILALDSDERSVEFRRIVVADKGRGTGRRAINTMETYCRDRLQRSRIWLDVFDFNERGRQVYSRLGYQLFDQRTYQGKQLLYYQKELETRSSARA
ncbi:MAG: hypothetical protein [Olavius algarvensis Gamma 3 endosymbiont]|nr:MAG: hypothetical protein [Olavius algarvensis Gamma 3 endosymbiont]